jgi:hypothetical protein
MTALNLNELLSLFPLDYNIHIGKTQSDIWDLKNLRKWVRSHVLKDE